MKREMDTFYITTVVNDTSILFLSRVLAVVKTLNLYLKKR